MVGCNGVIMYLVLIRRVAGVLMLVLFFLIVFYSFFFVLFLLFFIFFFWFRCRYFMIEEEFCYCPLSLPRPK